MKKDDLNNEYLENINRRLNSLEKRIELLESNNDKIIQPQPSNILETEDSDYVDLKFSISTPFETKLGEYGLAWLGNIVLFFAIVFLWQYFNDAGKPLISLLVGGFSILGVFLFSYFSRKSYIYLSFLFNLFGFIILYFVALRLHFFSDKPLISNLYIATFLILIAIGSQLFFAYKRKSQILAGMAFTFAIFTAFMCDQTQLFFLISIATTGLVLFSFWKYNWWQTLTITLIITYFIYLIWLLKNPVSLVKSPSDLTYYYAFFYFSITTIIYSLVAFKKPNIEHTEKSIISTILISGIAYSIVLLVLVISHYPNSFVPFFIAISIYGVVYSILLKFYSQWKYAPALFALYGFVAISVAIFGVYHFPDCFLLLTYQSFLVLALALWYRSHIITLMNTFLLIFLVLIYYKISGSIQVVNFSIPIVAFLSARIINWKKERLNIKTEFIRNMYLFVLFFTLLYATYKGLPGYFITISWLIISGIYFGLSILLKNIKYRWMAMANLLVSAIYLFLVDMAKIELIYRILAFLVFAIVSIFISTYYVKKLKKKEVDTIIEKTDNRDELTSKK